MMPFNGTATTTIIDLNKNLVKLTDQPLTEVNLNLQHLQAELSRIGLLVQWHMRRWQVAGQDFQDPFRGIKSSTRDIISLLNRSVGYSWGQMVSLSVAEDSEFQRAYEQVEDQIEHIIQTAYQQNQPLPRLVQLATLLNLERFAYDAFLVCLAAVLDIRYERFYGYLQDNVTRKCPTIDLILNVLGPAGPSRLTLLSYFTDDVSLFKYRLLEWLPEANQIKPPFLHRPLQVDQTVVAWLLGKYQPPTDLKSKISLTNPQTEDSHTLLTETTQADLTQLVNNASPPVAVFYGSDQVMQDAAAHWVAIQLGRQLLQATLAQDETSLLQVVQLVLRDARLTGAIPYLRDWDVCLVDGAPPMSLLAELCAYPDLAIVAGESAWHARDMDRERVLLRLAFIHPNYAQRSVLWQQFIKEALDNPNFDLLAGQFTLTTGQIRDAVASAKDMAANRGQPITMPDLFAAARAHSNPRLRDLARKITPRYVWADLVLSADLVAILRELVDTVQGQPKVLEEWGLGKKLASSSAVTVLFAGPPGTGKTMAAEVIAGELGLDLYKINLSSVVSKYIGETEKNLERIFKEAQNSNAILFFDEADSIFGKRSGVKDARDRYANLEVSYLLQRMESYDGITILATNLRSNLDDAFTRRLHFALDIPLPKEDDRLRIWQTLFPSNVPHQADLNFEFMAKQFKIAGGNIRNIIVGATYLAAADSEQVTMEHILHATRRELQKMGRLVSQEDIRLPDDGGNKSTNVETNRDGLGKQPNMVSHTLVPLTSI